eukprot:1143535-Amphidinium_carterae.1
MASTGMVMTYAIGLPMSHCTWGWNPTKAFIGGVAGVVIVCIAGLVSSNHRKKYRGKQLIGI